jgi:Family of unknown function (DUF6502)
MSGLTRKGAKGRGAAWGSGTIDAETRDAIHRFVRVLASRGCPTTVIQDEVSEACGRIGDFEVFDDSSPYLVDAAAHVLTLWFSEPAYTGSGGKPRPLPVSGGEPSLEALVRRVNAALQVAHVLEILLKVDSVRRVGARYVPRKRSLVMRDTADLPSFLGGLFGHLQTFEHNGFGPRNSPRLELYSVNRNIPVGAVAELEGKMRPMAERMLQQADATFHDAEAERHPGEQTVHMGLGVYQWILDPIAPTLPIQPPKSRRPGSR